MSVPKAFILHLERAISRAANVQSLKRPAADRERDPCRGRRRAPFAGEIDQAYARRRFQPRYPFALTATEVGVFLSHRAAWRRIVDEKLDFAVIFEDDAQIDPDRVRWR